MTPERRLYLGTVIFLAIYIPVETYLSRSNLLSPFFLVDVAGMALLLAGVLKRGSAVSAPLLVAGYAWSGANAWRGMADRLRAAAENRYGWVEADSTRILVGGAILILLAAVAMRAAIRLSAQSTPRRASAET